MRISDWSSDVCSSDLPGSGRTLPDLAATPLFCFAAIGLKIAVDTGVVNSFPCDTTVRSENGNELAASIVWSRPLRRLILFVSESLFRYRQGRRATCIKQPRPRHQEPAPTRQPAR